jgi:hypothetical protein
MLSVTRLVAAIVVTARLVVVTARLVVVAAIVAAIVVTARLVVAIIVAWLGAAIVVTAIVVTAIVATAIVIGDVNWVTKGARGPVGQKAGVVADLADLAAVAAWPDIARLVAVGACKAPAF